MLSKSLAEKRKALFNESDHPRGQPENAGQFGPGGGSEVKPNKDTGILEKPTDSRRQKIESIMINGGIIDPEIAAEYPDLADKYGYSTSEESVPSSGKLETRYPKAKPFKFPRGGSEEGYVYRIQPIGSELHGQTSMTSNDDNIGGVFVFDNLNELASIDWANEKNVELLKIKVSKEDVFQTHDQEGVGLKKDRGKVAGRIEATDTNELRSWATNGQRADDGKFGSGGSQVNPNKETGILEQQPKVNGDNSPQNADGIDYVKSERAQRDGAVMVMVNVDQMEAAWKKDGGYYIPPSGAKDKVKYDRQVNRVKEGKQLEAPEATYDQSTGTLSFSDGRHRSAAIRDSGKRELYITVPPEQAAAVTRDLTKREGIIGSKNGSSIQRRTRQDMRRLPALARPRRRPA